MLYNKGRKKKKDRKMMDVTLTGKLLYSKKEKWYQLLSAANLHPDEDGDCFALVWEGERLLAAGQRKGNLLKCLATLPEYRGEGLLAKVVTALTEDARREGDTHLFLYTKPENEETFSSLFFYPVAKTQGVLLMENKQRGIKEFLDTLPEKKEGDGRCGQFFAEI